VTSTTAAAAGASRLGADESAAAASAAAAADGDASTDATGDSSEQGGRAPRPRLPLSRRPTARARRHSRRPQRAARFSHRGSPGWSSNGGGGGNGDYPYRDNLLSVRSCN